MAGKRKIHGGAFKAQVALAAHKGDRTINELAGHYGVHATLIHAWKKQLLASAEDVFANGAKAPAVDTEAEKAVLFEQIGRLKIELEWLKKPEVFNTDQGAQFTAEAFTGRLLAAGVALSLDGRGRCLDNVFVERL